MSKTGFTCGSFDLCHYGHILMFKECKEQCDHLIVGLQINPNKDRPEKNIPIQSLEERWGQLEAIKYIDDVIVYETEDDLIQLLTYIQADIRFVGADWKDGKYTGWELDIPVIFNSRDHSFSTSELRQRIFQSEQKIRKNFLTPSDPRI
jgi:glycerol-3-phosphate cytidylyltransferase